MPQILRKRHKARRRALKNLDERFERYARAIEMEPASCKGRWSLKHLGVVEASGASGASGAAQEASEEARSRIRLDLGCGKGAFAVELAKRLPSNLVVGLDCDRTCIALAAQRACEGGVENVVFTLADAEDLSDLFAFGEVSCIYLNFPTPHPRKKHAPERLTYVDALLRYREILADGDTVEFRTDSPMLYEFSRAQFALAGFAIVDESRDLSADRPSHVSTEYELRLAAMGAKILACTAVMKPAPGIAGVAGAAGSAESAGAARALEAAGSVGPINQVPLSLYEYLPEDLDSLEYVPYGMEEGVENLRNLRAKIKARARL